VEFGVNLEMTDEEAERFTRNMAKDKKEPTVTEAIAYILHWFGFMALLIGLGGLVPKAFDYGLPAGLAYSGVVLIALSAILRRL
jgi:hypothetical protein